MCEQYDQENKCLTDEELERLYGMTGEELVEDMTIRDPRDLVICGQDS